MARSCPEVGLEKIAIDPPSPFQDLGESIYFNEKKRTKTNGSDWSDWT